MKTSANPDDNDLKRRVKLHQACIDGKVPFCTTIAEQAKRDSLNMTMILTIASEFLSDKQITQLYLRFEWFVFIDKLIQIESGKLSIDQILDGEMVKASLS